MEGIPLSPGNAVCDRNVSIGKRARYSHQLLFLLRDTERFITQIYINFMSYFRGCFVVLPVLLQAWVGHLQGMKPCSTAMVELIKTCGPSWHQVMVRRMCSVINIQEKLWPARSSQIFANGKFLESGNWNRKTNAG